MGHAASVVIPPQQTEQRDGESRQGLDYTLNIPDECLQHVFHYLKPGDRTPCSLVCKRWYLAEGQSRRRLSLDARAEIGPAIPSLFQRLLKTMMVLCNLEDRFATPKEISERNLACDVWRRSRKTGKISVLAMAVMENDGKGMGIGLTPSLGLMNFSRMASDVDPSAIYENLSSRIFIQLENVRIPQTFEQNAQKNVQESAPKPLQSSVQNILQHENNLPINYDNVNENVSGNVHENIDRNVQDNASQILLENVRQSDEHGSEKRTCKRRVSIQAEKMAMLSLTGSVVG